MNRDFEEEEEYITKQKVKQGIKQAFVDTKFDAADFPVLMKYRDAIFKGSGL